MICKIEAVNYKCLKDVSRSLDRFHVLAGPNGSGKSTFLEVVKVLGGFASDGLDSVWKESRAIRLEELFFCGRGSSFQMAVELDVPEALLDQLRRKNGPRPKYVRYEVEVGNGQAETDDDVAGEPRILAENLWLMDKAAAISRSAVVQQEFDFPSASRGGRSLITSSQRTQPGWRKVASKTSNLNAYFRSETSDWNFTLKNPPRRSALSTLPEDERFGLANWVKTQLAGNVQKLMLQSELMRRPCAPIKERRFLPDGSTLPLVVRRLRQDRKRFKAWLGHVRTILPIRDIEVIERPEDKHSYLRVAYDIGIKVPSWHLSDGTLRMLALMLLPYIDSLNQIYLIEEPENGVHPTAVEAICKSLSSIYEGQALVATHSAVLVGLIEPRQLLCFSRTPGGETDIIRGDQHPHLKEWRKDVSLGLLFAGGILS
jgi:predicted ATPase